MTSCFRSPAQWHRVCEATVKEALPRLATAIGNYNANESWAASSALDLIGSLARGAPDTGLGEGFFAAIAPTIPEVRDVLQVPISLLASLGSANAEVG
jgi:hypothetical protein